MHIKRAKEEIKNAIEAYLAKDERGNYLIPEFRQRPILLMGPPGIGKTQIMEQVARECQVALVAYTITHHTRQSAIGLPFIEKKEYGGREVAVTEYTMSEIVASVYDKMEQTGLSEGILFLDEINCASETLAPTMLQFLQYKTFGNHKIPPGWMIVTAGNPPEYNKSVREFDMATLDRVKKIDVEANFEVWKEYAYANHVHPAVIAYLSARPAHFYQLETTVDGRIFATPRGWEDLSGLIGTYEKMNKKVDREVVVQYLQHPKIAKDFANYLELYYKYQTDYRVDEILSGTIREDTLRTLQKAPFDEKLSVISLLLSRCQLAFRKANRREDVLSGTAGRLRVWREELARKEELGLASGAEGKPVSEMTENKEVESPGAALNRQAREVLAEREDRKRKELLTREQDYLLLDTAKALEDLAKNLELEHVSDYAVAEEKTRETFGSWRDEYEQLADEALASLEHAFDFMEAAFGDSQEMVVFLTELNTGLDSVRFLQENVCERYDEYNRRLLFRDREEELRERIRSLR